MKKNFSKKAQGALEYLLLIGGAVLIAVIVVALLVGGGGQSRDTAQNQATQAQQALDLPLEREIVSIETGSCLDEGMGAFSVIYGGDKDSGVHRLFVTDFANNKLDLIGPSKLNGLGGIATYQINLANYPNLHCGDSFYAYIETEKNNLKVKSSEYKFYWDSSSDMSAIFADPSALGGQDFNSNGEGYFESEGDFNFSILNEGMDGNIEWYSYSSPSLEEDCNDQTYCEIQFSSGIHKVNFITYFGVIDNTPDINNSQEIIISDTDLEIDSISGDPTTLTQGETIDLTGDLSGSLSDEDNIYTPEYNFTWKLESTTLSYTKSCSGPSSKVCSFDTSTADPADYDLILEVEEEKTGKTQIFSREDYITINGLSLPRVNILQPNDGDVFNIGEDITFEAHTENFEGILSCDWDSNIDHSFSNSCPIFTENGLSEGTHLIAVRASDGIENDTDSIIIEIEDPFGVPAT